MTFEALPGVSCKNCLAFCCGEGMVIPFSDQEADLVDRTNLVVVSGPISRRDTRRKYRLKGPCKRLVKDTSEWLKCGLQDSDEKPLACTHGFVEGGQDCHTLRERRFKQIVETS